MIATLLAGGHWKSLTGQADTLADSGVQLRVPLREPTELRFDITVAEVNCLRPYFDMDQAIVFAW